MVSVRNAIVTAGGSPAAGLRSAFQIIPSSVRELVRLCELPSLGTADLEPQHPRPFHAYRERNAQGIASARNGRWFLSSEFRVTRCQISGEGPFAPRDVATEKAVTLKDLLDQAGLPFDSSCHIGALSPANHSLASGGTD